MRSDRSSPISRETDNEMDPIISDLPEIVSIDQSREKNELRIFCYFFKFSWDLIKTFQKFAPSVFIRFFQIRYHWKSNYFMSKYIWKKEYNTLGHPNEKWIEFRFLTFGARYRPGWYVFFNFFFWKELSMTFPTI